jgi:hypothetical protein
MELEEVDKDFYGHLEGGQVEPTPPDEYPQPDDDGTPGRPSNVPVFRLHVRNESAGGISVPVLELDADPPLNSQGEDQGLRVFGRMRKKEDPPSDPPLKWRDMPERMDELTVRSGTVSIGETYEVQARWRDSRGRFGDWSPSQDQLIELDFNVGEDEYWNENLPTSIPIPFRKLFDGEANFEQYNPVTDGITDMAPLLSQALFEATERRIPLIIPKDMNLGIHTSVLLPSGAELRAYGAKLFKRAEFDLSAMFVNRDMDEELPTANPNKRNKGLTIRGLNIINNHPESEGYGFGGTTFDIFFDDAILEDIWCDVSNFPVPQSEEKANFYDAEYHCNSVDPNTGKDMTGFWMKANGRFMVWAGDNVRMNRITHTGAAGALERTPQMPWATGMTAGGFYCNGARDSSITNFVMQSDDDCVICIPNPAGTWNGSSYPVAVPNSREDLDITRVTFAHGRCWGWSGKIATASLQPNMGQRPNINNTSEYNAWKATWETPQQAEISHILYHDIKGFHSNNSFKFANTRSITGIRNITVRDCEGIMMQLYDPDRLDENNDPAPAVVGNPNSVFIEATHIRDENSTSHDPNDGPDQGNWDHDAPVEDILFENFHCKETWRNVVEFKTNSKSSPNESFFEKLLPKRIWFKGGVWDRPRTNETDANNVQVGSPVVNIDGVDGGGISAVRMAGRGPADIMVINDVPKGIGFTVEECIIEELSGGIAGIDAGGGVSVYGLQVLRNTFIGPSANQSTAAVKLNGRAGPPTNPEESFCQDALITGNNFKPIQVPDDQNPGQFILHPNPISIASESVPKNNEIYDNRGSDMDTRTFGDAVIPDGSITSAKLAVGAALGNIVDASIAPQKLEAGAALANLASGSITTAKIGDLQVTNAKLATGAALSNLANNSITSAKLASGTALANLASGSITADKFEAGAVLAGIDDGDITTLKLAVDSITEVYYANGTTTATTGTASIRPKAKCFMIAVFDANASYSATAPSGRDLSVQYSINGAAYVTERSMNVNYAQRANGDYTALQTICIGSDVLNSSNTANVNIQFRAQLSAATSGTVHIWAIELAR